MQKEALLQAILHDALEILENQPIQPIEEFEEDLLEDILHALDDEMRNFCVLSYHHEDVANEKLYKMAKHIIAHTLQAMTQIQSEYAEDPFQDLTKQPLSKVN